MWYSLGRAHEELGQVDEAIECYEKALEVDRFNNLASDQREALARLRQTEE